MKSGVGVKPKVQRTKLGVGLLEYSDDQARDESGKFSGGGGNPSPGSSSTPTDRAKSFGTFEKDSKRGDKIYYPGGGKVEEDDRIEIKQGGKISKGTVTKVTPTHIGVEFDDGSQMVLSPQDKTQIRKER